ncbi:protein ABHD15 [Alligator mississippiensis]|uniref:protein ABHD15 n=1 Tax=Alligator mississippiensis TaxID=8496 RepID=UPI0028775C41|nr:protein ABHD15 [Alligator mississippiensis]
MLPWAGALGLFLLLLLWGAWAQLWQGAGARGSGLQLVCKPSALATHLETCCQSLRGFWAAPWAWRALPSLQSLASLAGPADSRVHFVRNHLQLHDQGLVALDWVVGPGPEPRRRVSGAGGAPVLLLVPNSFGKITRNVSKLCRLALLRGYRPVVFNRRGHNGCPLSTARLQAYGDAADLWEAIQYIRYRCPGAQLFAVGESTGAGLLFSYLGECGSSSSVTAAACISPILSPREWMEAGCPWLWQQLLLCYQKVWLSRFATVLAEAVRPGSVSGSRSLRELEEAVFCQAQSWDSYWERNDPLRDVDEVATPVLCICSRDDPVCGGAPPRELFETNPYLFLALAPGGGHCGFFRDGLCSSFWSHELLLDFFQATVDFLRAEKPSGQARRRGAPPAPGPGACGPDSCRPWGRGGPHGWQRSYTR